MGTGNSRLKKKSSPPPPKRRSFSSFLICGAASDTTASTSNNPPTTTHDDDCPVEFLTSSDAGDTEVQSSMKAHSPLSCSEVERSPSTNGSSSDYSNENMDPLLTENRSRYAERNNDRKFFSESKEIRPDLLNTARAPYCQRPSELGSSSSVEPKTPDLVSIGDGCNIVIDVDSEKEGSKLFQEEASSSSPSDPHATYQRASRGTPLYDQGNSSSEIHASDISSAPRAADSPSITQLGVEGSQGAAPLSPGVLLLDRAARERNNGGVLHVDVVSISSSTLFNSPGEASNHDSRRNSRRLFWDAFSRRNSRRHSDSRTLVFSSEDADDLGSHDRWLLDFSGDLFEDSLGGDSGILGTRNRGTHEGRWHSRSEIWERFRGGFDESSRRTTFCASGLHPDGTCSCESFWTTEESSTRGSLSRIVMLAEALFEVLDEIHRQPLSLSLSMVSQPAPESVVNSFPIKNHKKPNAAEGDDQEVEQCYICLAEYEEGDKIRVLPCRHEYHISCVDKWLKEIHGVCPLCRGDVCAGVTEGAVSSA